MKKKSSDKRGGYRKESVRLRTAKGRKTSSTKWLERQLNDPYVLSAKKEGYRSRAAYKLIELDEKFGFLRSGQSIVDLGAAPGSWSQVAAEKIGKKGKIVGIDLLHVDGMPGAEFIKGDFLSDEIYAKIKSIIGDNKVDVVLSDMAANTTGHRPTDHIRTIALGEAAFEFALEVLKPGGVFISKTFQGGTEGELLKRIKAAFKNAKHSKPKASRPESPEVYLVAIGFKG